MNDAGDNNAKTEIALLLKLPRKRIRLIMKVMGQVTNFFFKAVANVGAVAECPRNGCSRYTQLLGNVF